MSEDSTPEEDFNPIEVEKIVDDLIEICKQKNMLRFYRFSTVHSFDQSTGVRSLGVSQSGQLAEVHFTGSSALLQAASTRFHVKWWNEPECIPLTNFSEMVEHVSQKFPILIQVEMKTHEGGIYCFVGDEAIFFYN